MTTDNWVGIMWDTYHASGNLSLCLFPLIIVVGNYITMNIFLAILLSTFSAASKAEAHANDLLAEKEAEEVAEAAKAAAALTSDARLLLKGSKLRRATSPSKSPSKLEDGSPASPAMHGGRVSLRVRSPSKSSSPPRQRGGISLASPDAMSALAAADGDSPLGAASAMAAAAVAHLGPEATLRATMVFRRHDADNSGSIDVEEMRLALRVLGLESSVDHCHEVMSRYDLDQSNSLELHEFLMLVRDTPPAPPTALGRFLHGMLPEGVQKSDFIKNWVAASAKRAALADQNRAGLRALRERQQRKQRHSHMRMRKTKYGSLNAWEVAFFRGAFERADIDGDGFLSLDEVYTLLLTLDEEPKSNATWDVLDANAARDDLST